MADATLSTTVSRRTILASAAAPLAVALPPAAGSAPPDAGPARDPDAALLRRIALVDSLGERYAAAQRARRRRHAGRIGGWPADPACWALFERYARAARAAIAAPARTPRGLRAKLELARKAARRGDRRVYRYEDDGWLDAALADLDRLAARVP